MPTCVTARIDLMNGESSQTKTVISNSGLREIGQILGILILTPRSPFLY